MCNLCTAAHFHRGFLAVKTGTQGNIRCGFDSIMNGVPCWLINTAFEHLPPYYVPASSFYKKHHVCCNFTTEALRLYWTLYWRGFSQASNSGSRKLGLRKGDTTERIEEFLLWTQTTWGEVLLLTLQLRANHFTVLGPHPTFWLSLSGMHEVNQKLEVKCK